MFRLFGIAVVLLLTPGVAIVRQPATPARRNLTEGEIILEGGTAPGTGNVILYHNGRLWSVCDDGWNLQAARVVCRSLGYPHALGHTSQSYFGQTKHRIGLDNVQCHGDEASIVDCQHEPFGSHNCDEREAAGVFCAPRNSRAMTRLNSRLSTTSTPRTVRRSSHKLMTTSMATASSHKLMASMATTQHLNFSENAVYQEMMQLDHVVRHRHKPSEYQVRVVNGRNTNEGRLEVSFDGTEWGVVCSDHWTMLEARVACRQAGLGFSKSALQVNFFGGETLVKMAAGVHCDGEEEKLSDCYHEESGATVTTCPRRDMVAGVVCATALPDLVPNVTLLAKSAYLQDQAMYYLQCAMEENCAAQTAFNIKRTRHDWHIFKRRLLRFSSSIWNFGTADFRPDLRKEDWEWHLCHMHYHSMRIFASYDIVDRNGNRVAEGHKASFCLEDVQCISGVVKKFACKGFSDQGITVGCADDYLHDIDCQWIDITDVKPGNYVFKVHINPEFLVAELDYNNNAAICDMVYSGFDVRVFNCVLGRG